VAHDRAVRDGQQQHPKTVGASLIAIVGHRKVEQVSEWKADEVFRSDWTA
jgi:hypothetical protein